MDHPSQSIVVKIPLPASLRIDDLCMVELLHSNFLEFFLHEETPLLKNIVGLEVCDECSNLIKAIFWL
jgi:hypothetical protein